MPQFDPLEERSTGLHRGKLAWTRSTRAARRHAWPASTCGWQPRHVRACGLARARTVHRGLGMSFAHYCRGSLRSWWGAVQKMGSTAYGTSPCSLREAHKSRCTDFAWFNDPVRSRQGSDGRTCFQVSPTTIHLFSGDCGLMDWDREPEILLDMVWTRRLLLRYYSCQRL